MVSLISVCSVLNVLLLVLEQCHQIKKNQMDEKWIGSYYTFQLSNSWFNLAEGHFGMWTGAAKNQTTNPPISK